ncbi:MAG: DUF3459 domain-containing protein [Alphaproteobacteria bacterium]|nr:DUF3459 domain-containing protein [Alphaproteobacteria bacterium]
MTTSLHELRQEQFPHGAEILEDGKVRFRLWAPHWATAEADHQPRIFLADKGTSLPMEHLGEGWFELVTDKAAVDSRYKIELYDDLSGQNPPLRLRKERALGSLKAVFNPAADPSLLSRVQRAIDRAKDVFKARCAEPSWVRIADPMSYRQEKNPGNPTDGCSIVFDTTALERSLEEDKNWQGVPEDELVLYQIHPGTFTKDGNLRAIADHLDDLKDIGVTGLQLMPIEAFGCENGWGYDGTRKSALHPEYGDPEDLVHLVKEAHKRGMAVLLDTVHNHFGPEGNFTWQLIAHYARFDDPEAHPDARQAISANPWGAAIDFTKWPVATYFRQANRHWLRFGIDGYRRDAVHAIDDPSHTHILETLQHDTREWFAQNGSPGRRFVTILENVFDKPSELEPGSDGSDRAVRGNKQWGDSFAHIMRVLMFRENPEAGFTNKGYYKPYSESDPVGLLGEVLTTGYASSIDRDDYERNKRSTRFDRMDDPDNLRKVVLFLQNHDQVGNTPEGTRIEELLDKVPNGKEKLKLATATLLLSPATPMLFMGQERGVKTRFPYFATWTNWLADAVRGGRREELKQYKDVEFVDPCSPDTVDAAKIDWNVTDGERETIEFHKELIQIRNEHIVPHLSSGVQEARYQRIGETGLTVEWTFGDGARFGLTMNAGNEPVTEPGRKPILPWSLDWFSQTACQPEAHPQPIGTGEPTVR